MSKRALASQERQAQVQRLGRLGKSLLMVVATVCSLLAVSLLAADQLYRPDTFSIEQLKIKGRFKYIQPADIEAQVRENLQGNFFSVELSDIANEVEKMPWVQAASVRREWPNTLLIEVTEQRPVMRWKDGRWVNVAGEVIDLPIDNKLLPKTVLSGNEKDARLMLQSIVHWRQKFDSVGLELVALNLSDSHAYRLKLIDAEKQQRFDLQLGNRETEQRLERFLELYVSELKDSNLIIERVDVRYPDGMAIKSEVRPESDMLAQHNFNQSLTGTAK